MNILYSYILYNISSSVRPINNYFVRGKKQPLHNYLNISVVYYVVSINKLLLL